MIQWRKSSYTGPEGGNCVEVAVLGDRIGVRDSKDPAGPVLTCPPAAMTAFVTAVKRGLGSEQVF